MKNEVKGNSCRLQKKKKEKKSEKNKNYTFYIRINASIWRGRVERGLIARG